MSSKAEVRDVVEFQLRAPTNAKSDLLTKLTARKCGNGGACAGGSGGCNGGGACSGGTGGGAQCTGGKG